MIAWCKVPFIRSLPPSRSHVTLLVSCVDLLHMNTMQIQVLHTSQKDGKILNEHINTHTSFCTGRLNRSTGRNRRKIYFLNESFWKCSGASKASASVNVCGQKTLNHKLKKHESWIRLYMGYIMLIDVITALLFVSLLLSLSKKRPIISRSRDGSGLTVWKCKNRRQVFALGWFQDIVRVLYLLSKLLVTFSSALSLFSIRVGHETKEKSGVHVLMPLVYPVPLACRRLHLQMPNCSCCGFSLSNQKSRV